jgi:hypothetical protein
MLDSVSTFLLETKVVRKRNLVRIENGVPPVNEPGDASFM